MSKRSVIISAGGVGKRMGAAIPKQFLLLNGKPIIMHTINRFLAFDAEMEVIIVLPKDQIEAWKAYCDKYQFTPVHKVVVGGAERFHSVKNGLAAVTGNWVAVHDAVRPLVSTAVLKNCFTAVEKELAVVPVLPPKQSLRKVNNEGSVAVDRSQFVMVQTPQCFSLDVLKNAYSLPYESNYTDDASVVERSGVSITLVAGNEENIKITTPMDLQWANFLLNHE